MTDNIEDWQERGAGRPSKFNQELLNKCYDYLENYREVGHSVPSVVGMAKYVGVGKSTLYNWAAPAPKGWGLDVVADLLEMMSEYQELDLINNGLTGDFNPAVTKMLLTRHGYADKTETDVTSGGQQLNAWTVSPVTTEKE